jgi:hypothetical protein
MNTIEGAAVNGGGRLTVVSWNMNHWQNSPAAREAGWEYLFGPLAEETGWDIALLQECLPSRALPRCVWAPVRDLAWGTAVVARSGIVRRIDLEDDSHPGCAIAADVTLDGGARCTAVSMYGLQEFRKHIDGEPYRLRYAVTAVHRILSDLTPLIDLHGRSRVKRPLVLGGDLNVSSQIDPPDRRRHREVLERFAGLGLQDAWAAGPDSSRAPDCICADDPCRHVRTHTHRRSSRPWQLDYVFVNSAWKPISAEACIDRSTWSRSDHAPVAVRLDATQD